MSTINGAGTKFLGYSKPDENGCCTATEWFVFLYFPIFPLKRKLIKMERIDFGKQYYKVFAEMPLVKKEVISTYLWGWVWSVLLLLGPLATTAILTETKTLSVKSQVFPYLLISSVIWFLVMLFLLYRWDLERGLPNRSSVLSRFMD